MDATLEANSKQTQWLIGDRLLRIDPLVPATIALDTTEDSLLSTLIQIGQNVELKVFEEWIEKKTELKEKLVPTTATTPTANANTENFANKPEAVRSCTIV
jgi:hypothetical protein